VGFFVPLPFSREGLGESRFVVYSTLTLLLRKRRELKWLKLAKIDYLARP